MQHKNTHEEIVMMNRRHFLATSKASSLTGRLDASFASPITDKQLLLSFTINGWR
jgi:hypothetical protein